MHITPLPAPSGFPGASCKRRALRGRSVPWESPLPSMSPSPMEPPLTWEALPYACPKCGKDMVAVPGSSASSLACFCPSPSYWRLQPCAALVPYTAADAQRRVLRPLSATGGIARGSPAAKPCAPEGAPPASVLRKTEGPMDGQGKEEDASSQRRTVARQGEARRGAVRLSRCPSPRWPEAQCDVTVIPDRQAGPRALGPRATKRAKRSQPVRARARTLTHSHTCSWSFVQLVRNVKDPEPLCLALDPIPFRLTLARARTHDLSKLPGRSKRNASLCAAQAPGAAR